MNTPRAPAKTPTLKRLRRCLNEPCQHVAALRVGAEPVLGRRRLTGRDKRADFGTFEIYEERPNIAESDDDQHEESDPTVIFML